MMQEYVQLTAESMERVADQMIEAPISSKPTWRNAVSCCATKGQAAATADLTQSDRPEDHCQYLGLIHRISVRMRIFCS